MALLATGVVPVRNGEGQVTGYQPNDVKLSAREWHSTITLGRSLIEGMMYDASFAKLREVTFGYTLPSTLLQAVPYS